MERNAPRLPKQSAWWGSRHDVNCMYSKVCMLHVCITVLDSYTQLHDIQDGVITQSPVWRRAPRYQNTRPWPFLPTPFISGKYLTIQAFYDTHLHESIWLCSIGVLKIYSALTPATKWRHEQHSPHMYTASEVCTIRKNVTWWLLHEHNKPSI
jgi:hypothetical protein